MFKAVVGIVLVAITPAAARTFGGYECTVDCSGHKTGRNYIEPREDNS
jgi:hypothetical protein